jgi:hypothetical protein
LRGWRFAAAWSALSSTVPIRLGRRCDLLQNNLRRQPSKPQRHQQTEQTPLPLDTTKSPPFENSNKLLQQRYNRIDDVASKRCQSSVVPFELLDAVDAGVEPDLRAVGSQMLDAATGMKADSDKKRAAVTALRDALADGIADAFPDIAAEAAAVRGE